MKLDAYGVRAYGTFRDGITLSRSAIRGNGREGLVDSVVPPSCFCHVVNDVFTGRKTGPRPGKCSKRPSHRQERQAPGNWFVPSESFEATRACARAKEDGNKKGRASARRDAERRGNRERESRSALLLNFNSIEIRESEPAGKRKVESARARARCEGPSSPNVDNFDNE